MGQAARKGHARHGGNSMTSRIRRSLVAAAMALAAAGAALHAQEIKSATLLTTDHWLDWERVSDAQISPDRSPIVYTRQAVNQHEDKWESSLSILNTHGSQPRSPLHEQDT